MLELLRTPKPAPPQHLPKGIVRTNGRVMLDDDGPRHFLSTTLMWSVWGYEHDRARWVEDNLKVCQRHGLDGIRTLGSVMGNSWTGRKIDPSLPGYEDALAGQIDMAFAHGLRQFPFTMLGDHYTDVHVATDRMIRALRGREEKIGYIEIANEWGHAVKISEADLMAIAHKVRVAFPKTLLALSRPATGDVVAMKARLKAIGGPCVFPRHTARSENDRNWRQARQAYDFAGDHPWSSINQEPPGPASSVGELWKPRQLGAMRWLSHAAGCGVFCHHTGNGVRGMEDPDNNRQPNLRDVKGIDDQFAALKMVERWLPADVQNWKVVNNGRDDQHPLQLPDGLKDGFWEGNDDIELGDCNKNYAVLGPDGQFMVGLFGLNGSSNTRPLAPRRAGLALYKMQVKAYDSLTGTLAFDGPLDRYEWLTLPGRQDREMSYIIVGQRL